MSELNWKSRRALTIMAQVQDVMGPPNSLNRRQGGCAVWIKTPILLGDPIVNGKHIFHKHFICDIIDTDLISVFNFNLDNASLEILKNYTRAVNHKKTLLIMGDSFQKNLYHGYLALLLASRGDFESAIATHDTDMAAVQSAPLKYLWKPLYGRCLELTENTLSSNIFANVYKQSSEMSKRQRWIRPKHDRETEEKHSQMLLRVHAKQSEKTKNTPTQTESMTDYLYDRYANKIYYPLDSETQIITKTYGTVAQKREYPKYTDIVYYMPTYP